jgi:alkylation response protein AidB-like acyl-CoA dehydrogenase
MDVRLSTEQRALRDSAAQVVDRLGVRAVGQLDDAERAAKLDAAVEASGWRELRVPLDGGTPLASAVEVAVVAEELARGLADAPFAGPTLAAELRRLAAAPACVAPETVAFTSDLSVPACSTDGALAQGAVALDAGSAASALVLVPAPGGHRLGELTLARGPAASPTAVDLTRPSTPVAPGVAVMLVADQERDIGDDDVARWTALGLSIGCADLVGAMQGALQLSRDYALERRQYGSAIGSFQAVQHLLADALVETEGSRSVALHAAWAVDALPAREALAAASVAKAYCARAALRVCETAIQIHGGIGNTWECLAHVYLRRALVSIDLLGGVGPSLARVLDHLQIAGGSGHEEAGGSGHEAAGGSGHGLR